MQRVVSCRVLDLICGLYEAQDYEACARSCDSSRMHFPFQRDPATALVACLLCCTVRRWAYLRDLYECGTYQGQKLMNSEFTRSKNGTVSGF